MKLFALCYSHLLGDYDTSYEALYIPFDKNRLDKLKELSNRFILSSIYCETNEKLFEFDYDYQCVDMSAFIDKCIQDSK